MTERRAWEPPLFEWTQLGPVPIELSDHIEDDGQRLAGVAMTYERRITVDSGLEDQALRVVTWHELLHLWLHDAGVGVPGELEEVIVQALASALVAREDFHASGGVPEGPQRAA